MSGALAAAAPAAYDAPFALFPMNMPTRGSLLGIEHLDAKDILGQTFDRIPFLKAAVAKA